MTESADRPDNQIPDSAPAPIRETGEPSDPAAVTRPLRISYVDGARLRRAILAGVQHVTGDREELDRINVFPVPDGDTGTNLALSLAAIADAVRPLESRSLTRVADTAAEASMTESD